MPRLWSIASRSEGIWLLPPKEISARKTTDRPHIKLLSEIGDILHTGLRLYRSLSPLKTRLPIRRPGLLHFSQLSTPPAPWVDIWGEGKFCNSLSRERSRALNRRTASTRRNSRKYAAHLPAGLVQPLKRGRYHRSQLENMYETWSRNNPRSPVRSQVLPIHTQHQQVENAPKQVSNLSTLLTTTANFLLSVIIPVKHCA